MKAPQFRQAETLGSFIPALHRIYDLTTEIDSAHDSVHAMTGYDISLPDEMRMAYIISALRGQSFEQAQDFARRVYEVTLKAFDLQRETIAVTLPHLATKDFCDVQSHVVPLDPREAREQYALGQRMAQKLYALTGLTYNQMDPAQIARLSFADMDFVVPAYVLKTKYETPENRVVSKATAKIFYEAACREGRGRDIPAAGAAWHGANRPLYADGIRL